MATTTIERGVDGPGAVRSTVIDDKYGALATVEYAIDGTDMARAVAMLGKGNVTPQQFAAWSAGRDNYLSERARVAARGAAGELRLYHHTQADAEATAKLAQDKQRHATGVVMLGGLNARFPVALHPAQWVRLLRHAPQIAAYLRQHAAELDALGKAHSPEKHKPIGSVPHVTVA